MLQNTDSCRKNKWSSGDTKRYAIISHKLKHLLECILYWVIQGNSLYLKPCFLTCKHSGWSRNRHAVTQFLCVRKCGKWLVIQRLKGKTFPFPQKNNKKQTNKKIKHVFTVKTTLLPKVQTVCLLKWGKKILFLYIKHR